MSPWWILAAAGAAAAGVGAGVREVRGRRVIARELPEEIAWGALEAGDVDALASWRRFRPGWQSGRRERRLFRNIAGRLARAKARQRRLSADRRKLLQVEILTLRTRLRRAQTALAAGRGTE